LIQPPDALSWVAVALAAHSAQSGRTPGVGVPAGPMRSPAKGGKDGTVAKGGTRH